MTFRDLAEKMTSIEGVYARFKQIEKRVVIIFWKGHSPIAHVFAYAFDYSLDYLKLYEMHYRDILQIDAWLHEYVSTGIEDREIPF